MSEEQKPNKSTLVKARPAPPEAEKWHDYLRRQKEESPQRLEEAAKFLSGMIAITLSIVATAIEKLLAMNAALTKWCLVTWLLSLVAAFLVVFPIPYKIVKDSSESIATMHRKSVVFKYTLLVVSMILFIAALVMLLVIFTSNSTATTGSGKGLPLSVPGLDTLP